MSGGSDTGTGDARELRGQLHTAVDQRRRQAQEQLERERLEELERQRERHRRERRRRILGGILTFAAIVALGASALGGYLVGRGKDDPPSPTLNSRATQALEQGDPRRAEQLARRAHAHHTDAAAAAQDIQRQARQQLTASP